MNRDFEASILAGTHECNNCDLPVTTPNPGGYCDECLAETRPDGCPVCEAPMLPDSLRRGDELVFEDDGTLVHATCAR